MAEPGRFTRSVADLERETRVDPKDMVELQDVSGPPHVYVEPGDLDRNRLFSPTGDGRLSSG